MDSRRNISAPEAADAPSNAAILIIGVKSFATKELVVPVVMRFLMKSAAIVAAPCCNHPFLAGRSHHHVDFRVKDEKVVVILRSATIVIWMMKAARSARSLLQNPACVERQLLRTNLVG